MPTLQKYRLLHWTLILLLSLNLFSYLVIKEIHQSQIHAVLGKFKKHEDLIALCFNSKTLQSIHWIEDHEFVLNDTWYDVVDKKIYEDGSVSFLVYKDVKEKQILSSVFDADHSKNSNSNTSTLHYEIHLYLPAEFISSFWQCDIASYDLKQETYSSLTKFVIKPPPRV
ncbi:MAG: hypothetical protein V9E90_11615 [Saprospiraceae bacterium]|jgi:hypothetical protein